MSELLMPCENCGAWAVREFGMDLTPLCQTCWEEAERNYEAAVRLHTQPTSNDEAGSLREDLREQEATARRALGFIREAGFDGCTAQQARDFFLGESR